MAQIDETLEGTSGYGEREGYVDPPPQAVVDDAGGNDSDNKSDHGDTDAAAAVKGTKSTAKGDDDTDSKYMDDDIKQLVSKYYLYHKHKEARQQYKLKDFSKAPPHSVVKSFSFIPDDIPIVLIMGETGTGKSSLCNKLCGVYYKLVEVDNWEFEVMTEEGGESEIFVAKDSINGVTQVSSWTQASFLGDNERQVIILDTPGLNDRDKQSSASHRRDLMNKLAALRRIDVVLIVFKDAGRLKQSHVDMLDSIISLFANNENFFNHFALAITNCDECDKGWRNKHKKKIMELQSELSKKLFNTNDDNNSEIVKKMPIFTFSNVQDSGQWDNAGNERWSQYKEFDRFYQFCTDCHKNTLVTGDYELMLKMDEKIERLQSQVELDHTSALSLLIGEMMAERKRLKEIYERNTKYLASTPKNALDGLSTFAKVTFGAAVSLGLPDSVDMYDSKDECKNEDNSNNSVWSMFGKITSKAVSTAVSKAQDTSGMLGVGVTSLFHGLKNTITNENHDDKVSKLEKEYNEVRRNSLRNTILDKQTDYKSLSVAQQLYSKYLEQGDEVWEKCVNEVAMLHIPNDEDEDDGCSMGNLASEAKTKV